MESCQPIKRLRDKKKNPTSFITMHGTHNAKFPANNVLFYEMHIFFGEPNRLTMRKLVYRSGLQIRYNYRGAEI
jgi:hypothetical protein